MSMPSLEQNFGQTPWSFSRVEKLRVSYNARSQVFRLRICILSDPPATQSPSLPFCRVPVAPAGFANGPLFAAEIKSRFASLALRANNLFQPVHCGSCPAWPQGTHQRRCGTAALVLGFQTFGWETRVLAVKVGTRALGANPNPGAKNVILFPNLISRMERDFK